MQCLRSILFSDSPVTCNPIPYTTVKTQIGLSLHTVHIYATNLCVRHIRMLSCS